MLSADMVGRHLSSVYPQRCMASLLQEINVEWHFGEVHMLRTNPIVRIEFLYKTLSTNFCRHFSAFRCLLCVHDIIKHMQKKESLASIQHGCTCQRNDAESAACALLPRQLTPLVVARSKKAPAKLQSNR